MLPGIILAAGDSTRMGSPKAVLQAPDGDSFVVRIIRTFRPDVIITRFSPQPGGTHGHHTASAVLVLTADQDFARAAADEILVLDPASGTLTPSSGWRRWFS